MSYEHWRESEKSVRSGVASNDFQEWYITGTSHVRALSQTSTAPQAKVKPAHTYYIAYKQLWPCKSGPSLLCESLSWARGSRWCCRLGVGNDGRCNGHGHWSLCS